MNLYMFKCGCLNNSMCTSRYGLECLLSMIRYHQYAGWLTYIHGTINYVHRYK